MKALRMISITFQIFSSCGSTIGRNKLMLYCGYCGVYSGGYFDLHCSRFYITDDKRDQKAERNTAKICKRF